MHGIQLDVSAPVEIYEALHAQVVTRVGPDIDGLVLHLGRETASGFQIVEVWESKDHYDRFNEAVVFPLMRAASDTMTAGIATAAQEFDIRGLIVPLANLAQ